MSLPLIIFLVVLFIITMALTLYAFRQEDMKMKKYEEEGDTVQDELRRSHEYEATSIKTYIPIQIWIYAITFIIGIVAFLLYLYLWGN